ncbi:MAG: DUF4364 family protein [Bacillota bacterium]|nr:DUF4364 family protein [Bacillota bacterium]
MSNLKAKYEEILRAKVIILYILDYFNIPITREQLTGFIAAEVVINYFDLPKYIDELIEVGHIEKTESEGNVYLIITDSGRDTVKLFINDISQTLRRTLNDAVDERRKSFSCITDIQAQYVKVDKNEYDVQLSINEGAYRLMYLQLSVLTNKDAKKICENWRNNARFMYGDLLNLLTSPNYADAEDPAQGDRQSEKQPDK